MLNIKPLVLHLPKPCLHVPFHSNVKIAYDCTQQNEPPYELICSTLKANSRAQYHNCFLPFWSYLIRGTESGGIICWNLSILSVSHSLKPLDPVFLAAPFYQEGEEKSTEQVFLTWKTTISRNSQGKNLETFRFCTCHWEINLGYMFASLKQAFFNINFSSAQAPDFSEGSHAAWGNCATQR